MVYQLYVGMSQTYNASTNQSTVSATVYLRGANEKPWGNYAYWSYSTSWSLYIDGAYVDSGSGPTSLNTDQWGNVNSYDSGWVAVGGGSKTFDHNGDGTRRAIGASGYFSGSGGFSPGDLSAGNSVGALDAERPPNGTSTPTFDARVGGTSNIKMYSGGTVPSGAPGIDYFRWYVYPSGQTPGSFSSDQYSGWTWTGADYGTDYYVYAQAHSSEGWGPWSTGAWAYAAPYINSISLPATGTVGKSYSGSITGTKVDSYTIVNGSLPPGLSVSGGTIVGTPQTPGVYTFTIRANRSAGGTSYDSAPQTIQILAGGPWVNLPDPWLTKTITNVVRTNNVATITTSSAHGVTELNQPITIDGLTGGQAVLNGDWIVTSWTNNTLVFSSTGANITSAAATGTPTVSSKYMRSSIKVRVNGQWVQGYMRVYDSSYTGSDGTHWKNTA